MFIRFLSTIFKIHGKKLSSRFIKMFINTRTIEKILWPIFEFNILLSHNQFNTRSGWNSFIFVIPRIPERRRGDVMNDCTKLLYIDSYYLRSVVPPNLYDYLYGSVFLGPDLTPDFWGLLKDNRVVEESTRLVRCESDPVTGTPYHTNRFFFGFFRWRYEILKGYIEKVVELTPKTFRLLTWHWFYRL